MEREKEELREKRERGRRNAIFRIYILVEYLERPKKTDVVILVSLNI